MMSGYRKALAACVTAVFIIPNLYTMLKGQESFPFTPAPMFCHYIGENTRFYDFEFVGEGDSVEKVVAPYHAEHENPLAVKRFFFDKIYGSAEAGSPFGYYEQDTREKLQQRLGEFCAVYFKYLNDPGLKRLRLRVREYDTNYVETASHVIGYFDIASQHFIHTWNQEQ